MAAVLGLSFNYHDAAAALIVDGRVVAAAEQERFSRRKHDASLPVDVVSWMVRDLGVERVDRVVFYERPLTKFDRVQRLRRGRIRGWKRFHRNLARWSSQLLWVESDIDGLLAAAGLHCDQRVQFVDHHHSHAASAFYPSPFERAAVLCLDGVGEWVCSSVASGEGADVTVMDVGVFPHSLGLFYAAMTSLAGFEVNSGEYKLMGLAPYGSPRFVDVLLERVIDVDVDGGVRLEERAFDFVSGNRMWSPWLCEVLFQSSTPPPMRHGEVPTEVACDVAASAQQVCDLVMAAAAKHAVAVTGCRQVALAGGVALNCVSVGKLLEAGVCDDVFVQPASSDAGGALGAAWLGAVALGDRERAWVTSGTRERSVSVRDGMRGACVGPTISDREVTAVLNEFAVTAVRLDRDVMDDRVAELIAEGAIVGVARGPMEFGPRALGNRSILADPRSATVQRDVNLAVKFRESFRPFAPAVLRSAAAEWFEYPFGSPYMTVVASVAESRRVDVPNDDVDVVTRVNQVRSQVPAVTHVDGSARVQLVDDDDSLAGVVRAFHRRTGVPMVVNTSFNRRGEPIVCSALDAYRCFCFSGLTHLVLGDWLVSKAEQGERWVWPDDVGRDEVAG